MFEEILKKIKSIPYIVYLIIFLIFVIVSLKKHIENNKKIEDEKKKVNDKKENFEMENQPAIRYMYNSSGIKRNSSYDSRAEPSFIQYEPEKTGNQNHSDLSNNYTNDRVMKN